MSWLDDELVSSSSGNFTVPEDLTVVGDLDVAGDTTVVKLTTSGVFTTNSTAYHDSHFFCQKASYTATAGGDNTSANTATAFFSEVTSSASDGDGIRLPSASADRTRPILIRNNTANRVDIYANGDEEIDNGGAGGVYQLLAGAYQQFNANGANDWVSIYTKFGDLELVGDTTVSGTLLESADIGITAFSGGGNASAVAITERYSTITTCAADGDSVILPAAPVAGQVYEILNDTANDCNVFPGDGDTIDSIAADTAYPLAGGSCQKFMAISAAAWKTLNKGQRLVGGTAVINSATNSVMTRDATFNELDTSGWLPPSAYGKPSLWSITTSHTSAVTFAVRSSGAADAAITAIWAKSDTASNFFRTVGTIAMPTNGKVEYYVSAAAGTQAMYLIGYWVEG